ncbi:MAG TPA: cation:proton antiporter, partial [Ktedonobacteraceae bacterium]|nr:cation:proton antiporter [Ktedonobacteraceae bacterium]
MVDGASEMLDIVLVVREMVLALLIGVGVIIVTRRFSLPYTLGLVIVGLLLSVFGLTSDARLTPDLVLFVFLPALIFEGAWSLRLNHLRQNWWIIFLLAVPGLAVALLLIAVPIHFLAGVDWATALLLGAILSPTDPIAVLGLFRQLKVNASLSTVIEGESLFNDGVAGSLYQTFLAVVLLAIHGG